MSKTLRDYLQPQPKSKVKAGQGLEFGTYKFFTSSAVQSKYLNEYSYDEPALIFGTGGSASVHYCNEPFSTSTDCIVMYAKESADLKLLYYYLNGNIVLLQNGFKGAGLQHISKQYILDIPFEMPSNDVVKDIVLSFDYITDLSIMLKRQNALFDEMVKSRFIEMFGDPVKNEKKWNTIPLEDACISIVDCPHSTPHYTYENTGYMCIRTSIVKKNQILWDEIEYIPEDEYLQRIKRRKPQKGDIIYTREGAILGIAAIIDRECNVALGQRSMLLSPDTSVCLPEFLSTAMNFDSFLNKVLERVSGSASPHINVGDIRIYNIMMPPVELQNIFAAFVQEIDKSKYVLKCFLFTRFICIISLKKYGTGLAPENIIWIWKKILQRYMMNMKNRLWSVSFLLQRN